MRDATPPGGTEVTFCGVRTRRRYIERAVGVPFILAFTVLNVFTNTAAALPCEMNEDGTVKAPEPKRSPGAMLRERFAKQRAARAEKDAKKN